MRKIGLMRGDVTARNPGASWRFVLSDLRPLYRAFPFMHAFDI